MGRQPKRAMRKLYKAAIAVAVFYLALSAALLAVMRRPVLFGKMMSEAPSPILWVFPFKPLWYIARAGTLSVGEPAPDFTLTTPEKKGRVQLSTFRGQKPVVLVFGSYT